MNMIPVTSGAIAAQAARARQQLIILEEEEMTPYTKEDLNNEWEFKIVRANTNVFDKPENLLNLVRRESQAGWILLEKFDGTRVRFKRLRSQTRDQALREKGIDPYRTYYGMSPSQTAILVIGITLVFLLIGMGIPLVLLLTTSFRYF